MPMNPKVRLWLEVLLASLTVGLVFITIVSPNWIEVVFHIDPDQSSGSLEWTIVGGLLVASIALIALARADWRRMRSPEI
jgi:hypothetical protein